MLVMLSRNMILYTQYSLPPNLQIHITLRKQTRQECHKQLIIQERVKLWSPENMYHSGAQSPICNGLSCESWHIKEKKVWEMRAFSTDNQHRYWYPEDHCSGLKTILGVPHLKSLCTTDLPQSSMCKINNRLLWILFFITGIIKHTNMSVNF